MAYDREKTMEMVKKYGLREVMTQFAKASYLYSRWSFGSIVPESSRFNRYKYAFAHTKAQRTRWDLIGDWHLHPGSETELTECGIKILCAMLDEDGLPNDIRTFIMEKWAGLIGKDHVLILDKSSGSYISMTEADARRRL